MTDTVELSAQDQERQNEMLQAATLGLADILAELGFAEDDE